ncbi:hypothetical protein C9374_011332 [Naegleria lovaniensis]|uniref:Uncharacterized protein n=1 Tax=Naegleria lovaniensis TaxID=51637 RepID=A0AA88H426_NAELO|nr:uncharacterized protein C9374_011332 [Naegleria lovaniensis]KAG2392607.1 hypothetical protein C9374_011332 [Naegleria lovaniensis]
MDEQSSHSQMKFKGSTSKTFFEDEVVKQIELQYECTRNLKDQQQNINETSNQTKTTTPQILCNVTKNIYQNTIEEYYKRRPFKLLKSEKFFKLTPDEMNAKFDIHLQTGNDLFHNNLVNFEDFFPFPSPHKLIDSLFDEINIESLRTRNFNFGPRDDNSTWSNFDKAQFDDTVFNGDKK